MSNTFAVPKIQSDATASAATFNAPLNYIQTALNTLVQDIGKRSACVQYQVPVATGVAAGDLVYYDSDSAVFKQALGGLSQETGEQGQAIQTKASHVQGLILSINTTEYSAVMLRAGYCSDSIIQFTLGDTASAGLYYLSQSNSGKATKAPGWDVRIPCISYYGNNQFSFMPFVSSYIGQGAPVVRKINSTTLQVSDSNYGQVTVQQKPYVITDTQLEPYAVAFIDRNNNISRTPIVSVLQAGPGISAVYKGFGAWKLSLSSLVGKPVPATDFDLRGTLRVNQGLLTYTVFPKSAQTSMTMLLNVPSSVAATAISSVKVWMTTRGPGGCTYNIALYWLPFAAVNQYIQIPSSFATTSITANGGFTDRLYYKESSEVQADIKTQGVIAAVVSTSGNTQDCYIHQAGFVFNTQDESNSSNASNASDAGGLTRQDVLAILAQYFRYNPTYTD